MAWSESGVIACLAPNRLPVRCLMDATIDPWWEDELAGCVFVDERLGQRLRKLIERMAGAIGASLPLAGQDWANTKAAYRFFCHDRDSEAQILAGHFQATHDRFAATDGPILVIQDTTEFTFQRQRAEAVGITCRVNSGKDEQRQGQSRPLPLSITHILAGGLRASRRGRWRS